MTGRAFLEKMLEPIKEKLGPARYELIFLEMKNDLKNRQINF